MEAVSAAGYTAKTLATILLDEVNKLYDSKPGDDATACVIKIRKRVPMNLLFGPPSNRDDANRMMALFFSKAVSYTHLSRCRTDISSVLAQRRHYRCRQIS